MRFPSSPNARSRAGRCCAARPRRTQQRRGHPGRPARAKDSQHCEDRDRGRRPKHGFGLAVSLESLSLVRAPGASDESYVDGSTQFPCHPGAEAGCGATFRLRGGCDRRSRHRNEVPGAASLRLFTRRPNVPAGARAARWATLGQPAGGVSLERSARAFSRPAPIRFARSCPGASRASP